MTDAIDIPQYRQIADTMRRRIRDGVYRPGEYMPTAAALEAHFDVSNITVRKAVAILAEEGYVTGRRGAGTVVTATPPAERATVAVSDNFREWFEPASGERLPFEQELIDIGLELGPPRVAGLLADGDHKPLWRMRRLRRIRGVPVSFHVSYGRPEMVGDIEEISMADNRNFVDVMRRDLGLDLAHIDQTIEAAVADRDLAGLLEVAFGDPLFFVENVYTAPDEAVVAVTHLYCRGDRYAYRARIELEDE